VVGRPNVGKSTLFNRLIRKRRAITDPTPGVTRDPIVHTWMLGTHRLSLVDTGGFKVEGSELDHLVTQKSVELLKKADLILLIMDVTDLTGEDEAFLDHLRPWSDKTVLVVNKVDNTQRETDVWNYCSFGFGNPVPVSAAHGIGIDLLEDAVTEFLETHKLFAVETEDGDEESSPEGDEPWHEVRLALLGKPNTGKSTLANLFIGHEASLVSEIPGTTRDVVEGGFQYRGTPYTILDTAGIRRKKKVGENIEYYSVNRALAAIDDADVVLLMIDAQEGLSEQDKKITSQIIKRGKGVVLVLNKWDLVKDVPNMIEAIADRVRFLFPVLDFAPLVPVSAKTGEGTEKLLSTVHLVRSQMAKRVETGRFNQKLKEWGEQYQPPRGKRGHFKVLYGTQIGVEPVRFLLFVNRKTGFPQGYISYLTNKIRKELGFSHVPVIIDTKERR
jgi:GTPase